MKPHPPKFRNMPSDVPAAAEAGGLVASNKPPLLSTWEVVLHLLKGCIGAGALSLPYAFAKVGVVAGPVLYLGVVRPAPMSADGMSFGDVAQHILGRRGKTIVNVFLVTTQLSFCCVYFTVVATNLHAILPSRYPNGAMFLGIGIVFYYSATYVPPTPVPLPTACSWTSVAEFYGNPCIRTTLCRMIRVGTAVYSFEGIGLVLPLEKDMQDKDRFRQVLRWTMWFVLTLFLCLGELPVLAFGVIDNGSMTAVLQQYVPGWPVALANVLLAMACLFTFPIQLYPALEVLEKLLLRHGYFT
ncbi:hypothetical protein B5M09_012781, partial [Aphanomyces astaci]